MSVDHELRRSWRTKWLSLIQEFADYETQRRLWLDPNNTNPHYAFVEYFCCYFDDLGLSDRGYDRAIKEGLVSRDEVEAVDHFHQIAGTYKSPTDDDDHETILADPNWAALVEAARRAQAALRCLIQNPQERRLLAEP